MENVVHVSDVLRGEECKGKIVDMGFWFDVPHIVKQTLEVLAEKKVLGVRLVIETDLLKELISK